MTRRLKAVQFRLTMTHEGGGERVMRYITKSLGATILTMLKDVKGREIKEISDDVERKIAQTLGCKLPW